MTRKEAATIMKNTYEQHKYWWKSAKNERASKQWIEAHKIWKEIVNQTK